MDNLIRYITGNTTALKTEGELHSGTVAAITAVRLAIRASQCTPRFRSRGNRDPLIRD